jgi:hypothetical protein
MGWFTTAWGPEYYFKRASDAINRWWDSIKGTPPDYAHGLIKIIIVGPVVFILAPTPALMRMEYKARLEQELPIEAAGITVPKGEGQFEIYGLYKLTKAGNEAFNEWTLGHELCHYFQVVAGTANPDNVDKAEFY